MIRRVLISWLLLVGLIASVGQAFSPSQTVLFSDGCPTAIKFQATQTCPNVDLNFSSGQAWVTGNGYVQFSTLASNSNSTGGYVTNSDGTLTLIGPNLLRIGIGTGLLVEEGRTNVVLWSRDLTQAAWTPTNITTAKDQTGPDETANSASSILATAGNATILQAITLASSARFQTAYVKRLVGSGVINMTMDNGSTWTSIAVTSAWTRVSIPAQTLANPTVGFQIVTSGDKIAVDLVQNENGTYSTSPIATTTTSSVRNTDVVSVSGALLTGLNTTVGSIFAQTSGVQNTIGYIISNATGGGSGNLLRVINSTQIRNSTNGVNLTATVNSTTGVLKSAIGFDANGRYLVGNNGTAATDGSVSVAAGSSIYIGSNNGSNVTNGTVARITVWRPRLPDGTIQSITR